MVTGTGGQSSTSQSPAESVLPRHMAYRNQCQSLALTPHQRWMAGSPAGSGTKSQIKKHAEAAPSDRTAPKSHTECARATDERTRKCARRK